MINIVPALGRAGVGSTRSTDPKGSSGGRKNPRTSISHTLVWSSGTWLGINPPRTRTIFCAVSHVVNVAFAVEELGWLQMFCWRASAEANSMAAVSVVGPLVSPPSRGAGWQTTGVGFRVRWGIVFASGGVLSENCDKTTPREIARRRRRQRQEASSPSGTVTFCEPSSQRRCSAEPTIRQRASTAA